LNTFNYAIHVIGAGHLGAALIQGLILSGIAPSQIYITEHDENRCKLITKELGVKRHSNEIVDITLLCIKPQQLGSLTLGNDYKTQVIVSTLAGTEIETLKEVLGQWPIIRAMPNLAAFYQASMTALYFDETNKKIRSMIDVFFQRIGSVIWLEKESELHLATAIVGSGPAFFLDLMNGIINIDSKAPIAPMLYGSIESALTLAKNSDGNLSSIIKAITSPAGTTEAGLKLMKQKKVTDQMSQVFEITMKKSANFRSKNTDIT
jgi:pyrroline-5-carboxylate reductase